MKRSRPLCAAVMLAWATGWGCSRHESRSDRGTPPPRRQAASSPGDDAFDTRRVPRPALPPLATGEVYVYEAQTTAAHKVSEAEARARGLLVVDLGDGWAPFIFQDSGDGGGGGAVGGGAEGEPSKPNGYRKTFVDLANDRIAANGRPLDPARREHNFLEPFGIPPTLGVLYARVERDVTPAARACERQVDVGGLLTFGGNVPYADREQARRAHAEALRDADWLNAELERRRGGTDRSPDGGGRSTAAGASLPAADRAAAIAALRADPNLKVKARVERALRGQERLRAVRAVQARLLCDGLLSAQHRFTSGMFDLPTHETLAEWERKNDIFGWASVGGETLTALARPALELTFETLRRILAERVADAAGIVEDGSTAKWKDPPTYFVGPGGGGSGSGGDAGGGKSTGSGGGGAGAGASASGGAGGGARLAVPNLIGEYVTALLGAIHVQTPIEMIEFLRQHGPTGLATLRVAMVAPPLPPYYAARMDLAVEIDRGDVWYELPFDQRGRPVEQRRENYPHLTLFVNWAGQKIPLCSWRTTIGSWRSELHTNGKVYYKYKNSDVGPRLWKHIVAGPVWIPPDATPARDLLTRRVLDREKGPEVVVNTEVMGPGFQSAYGLVMAIHIDRGGFDNQIRTHGSVDYTSIARRFSHGCHRLVNNRAVRLFDFVLRRQPFRRVGAVPISLQRTLVVDHKSHVFELKTRGYYYELLTPLSVTVSEGRIMGANKAPITAYVRKAGVDYRDVATHEGDAPPDPATGDSTAGLQIPPSPPDAPGPQVPDDPSATSELR